MLDVRRRQLLERSTLCKCRAFPRGEGGWDELVLRRRRPSGRTGGRSGFGRTGPARCGAGRYAGLARRSGVLATAWSRETPAGSATSAATSTASTSATSASSATAGSFGARAPASPSRGNALLRGVWAALSGQPIVHDRGSRGLRNVPPRRVAARESGAASGRA
jgi:hypothetical protein